MKRLSVHESRYPEGKSFRDVLVRESNIDIYMVIILFAGE